MTDVSHTTNVEEPTDESQTTDWESLCVIRSPNWNVLIRVLGSTWLECYAKSENGWYVAPLLKNGTKDPNPTIAAEFITKK